MRDRPWLKRRHISARTSARNRPIRILVVSIAITLLSILWLGMPDSASAFDRRGGDTIIVAPTETINDDLLVAGTSVRIAGRVMGDVFAIGQFVAIEGAVDGDVFVLAENVSITGPIKGSVRTLGETVVLGGTVTRNVLGAGQSFKLLPSTQVDGSLAVAGQTVALAGSVGRGILLAAGNATLQNAVGGDVTAYVDELTVMPSTRIKGGIDYWRRGPAIEFPLGVITGPTTYHAIEGPGDEAAIKESLSAAGRFLWIIWLIGTLIVSAIVMAFLPGAPSAALNELADHPVRAFAIGLGGMVGFPLVGILISFTLIGIPFVLLASGLWLAGIYIGWMILAGATGAFLMRLIRREPATSQSTSVVPSSRFAGVPLPSEAIALSDTPRPVEVIVAPRRPALHASLLTVAGMMILWLATQIPGMGGVVSFIGVCLGLGLAVTLVWGARNGCAA